MTLRGFLTRTPTGIGAVLNDALGYQFALTGIPAEVDGQKGYRIEVVMTRVPEEWALPGDNDLQ